MNLEFIYIVVLWLLQVAIWITIVVTCRRHIKLYSRNDYVPLIICSGLWLLFITILCIVTCYVIVTSN